MAVEVSLAHVPIDALHSRPREIPPECALAGRCPFSKSRGHLPRVEFAGTLQPWHSR
jgi:hypothetical protein